MKSQVGTTIARFLPEVRAPVRSGAGLKFQDQGVSGRFESHAKGAKVANEGKDRYISMPPVISSAKGLTTRYKDVM